MSPAAANTVLGFVASSCLTAPAMTEAISIGSGLLVPEGRSARRPWKSLVARIWTSTVAACAGVADREDGEGGGEQSGHRGGDGEAATWS